MKRSFALVAAGIAAAAIAGQATAGSTVDVTIRHQVVGCHAWAIGTGAYRASQSLTVKAGTTFVFTNDDVMPHTLVQVSGPRVTMRSLRSSMPMQMGPRGRFGPGTMARMGAGELLTLLQPGTYRFTTKAGEDYVGGVRTVGEDNVLRLVVTVK
jgi:plastocyanin